MKPSPKIFQRCQEFVARLVEQALCPATVATVHFALVRSGQKTSGNQDISFLNFLNTSASALFCNHTQY